MIERFPILMLIMISMKLEIDSSLEAMKFGVSVASIPCHSILMSIGIFSLTIMTVSSLDNLFFYTIPEYLPS